LQLALGNNLSASGQRVQWCRGLQKFGVKEIVQNLQMSIGKLQRRLWVLKSSILPLHPPSSHMGDFQPQILYFWKKIFGQEDNFPTG